MSLFYLCNIFEKKKELIVGESYENYKECQKIYEYKIYKIHYHKIKVKSLKMTN